MLLLLVSLGWALRRLPFWPVDMLLLLLQRLRSFLVLALGSGPEGLDAVIVLPYPLPPIDEILSQTMQLLVELVEVVECGDGRGLGWTAVVVVSGIFAGGGVLMDQVVRLNDVRGQLERLLLLLLLLRICCTHHRTGATPLQPVPEIGPVLPKRVGGGRGGGAEKALAVDISMRRRRTALMRP